MKIIRKRLDENADLLIGVDDPEVNELVNVLVNAVAEAIKINNEQLSNDLKENFKKFSENGGLVDSLGGSLFRRHY